MPLDLLYFANPMCSWCWGFAPVIRHLMRAHGEAVRLTVVLGALGRGQEPMRPEDKVDVRAHWEHVHARTGQPFDFNFFDREGFVYDTEPSCRAVAAVRAQRPELALPCLVALHEAFYARNRDITQTETLQDIAQGLGVNGLAFTAAFEDPFLRRSVAEEFAQTARLGVTGYPTLLGLAHGRAHLLSLGCSPLADMTAALQPLLITSSRTEPAGREPS